MYITSGNNNNHIASYGWILLAFIPVNGLPNQMQLGKFNFLYFF